ncbi:cytochrome P450 [Mycena rebaudengoi]|nr:cytochrome P450 [Mycena rebaudengoi]
MTLDSIGELGFNYAFNSLDPNGKPSELMTAMTKLLHSASSQSSFVVRYAQATFPILRLVPMPGTQVFEASKRRLFDIGARLMAESKAYVEAAGDKNISGGRDLLSVLIKANMVSDLPDNQRLSDDEVIAQVPTFVIAGHENTSTGTAWALHALSLNHEIQDKLRQELLSARSESPNYDELNSLPYLENVVRETMRLYPPVEHTGRMAMADDILPLSEPFVDKKGRVHEGIPIRKGQMIHIPLRAVNVDKALWGDDAEEFKPDRWDNLPKAVSSIPSVYANTFTFYAGSHSCIGFRLSIIEQKALLFSLVRAFTFENVHPKGSIGRTSATSLQRPIVLAEREKGTQMPLIIKPYNG